MDELAKMYRVINRELPDASVEALLVLDAATGQNAVNQANAAVDVAIMLSDGKSIKDYAGAADTGYQVWVDFEKVDASNVDDYLN